jgi:flagella basal body P-ring formation protein FlgA
MVRLLLFFLCAPAMAVTLHEESVVSDAFIRLGDIAHTEVAELRELRIGHSPRAGASLVLGRAEVERAVARLKPALAARIGGAERVTVRRGPLAMLELARVQQVAEAALRRALAERFGRYEIEAATESARSIALPVGVVELKPRTPVAVEDGTPVTLWTDVLVEGRHYQSIPLRFSVRATEPITIAPELRAAKAGGVTRNQAVLVRVALGAVTLETTAIAIRDGRPGDVIRVRNSTSNQTYRARVAGPGMVEVLWR